MVKRKVAALEKLDADLPSLQYKIRRDPRSYKEEFLRQWEQYESQRDIFLISPATASPDSVECFHNVIDLIAHVAECYPDDTRNFPDDLKAILSQHHAILHTDLRGKIVGSLVLLRRKDVIDSSSLLTTLFPILVSSPSKSLRGLLFSKILADLRNSNSKATNHPLNRTVQTVLHNLVTVDKTSPKALWAIKLTRELWKRQIWTDAKPVQVMKEACLSDNEKVVAGAVRFFLGGDKEREALDDESTDDEAVDLKQLKHQIGINKKTKKKSKAFERAVSKVKRSERKKTKPHPLNFSALHLLHDPQGFADAMFTKHLQSRAKLSHDIKLLILQLVTRLVGLHQLTILNLYSWFAKFLTPRQQNVTTYLACLAQATHNLVPPDAIEPLLVKIANEFVSEGSAAEVATAGLNAIRETCVRQPLAMTDTLLQDLVQYRRSKDKGVMMAAKGLLSLYREVGADMLKRKDRGKEATMGIRAGEIQKKRFGQEAAGEIQGLHLLQKWKEDQRKKKWSEKGMLHIRGNDDETDSDEEWNSDEWEVASEDSDDSGGWIDVSEDEGPPAKKAKLSKEGRLTNADSPSSQAPAQGDQGMEKGEEDGNDDNDGNDDDDDDDDDDDNDNDDASRGSNPEPTTSEQDDDDEEIDSDTIDGIATSTPASRATSATSEAHKSNLATTSILTPADLAKLQQLRMEAGIASAMGHRPKSSADDKARHADDALTAEQIEQATQLGRKQTKEEKMAWARENKPDRDEHKSTQAIRRSRKEAEGKSTTNKEKSRKKHMLMTLGKAKAKQRRSLATTSKILRGHVQRAKRGGRRGNRN